MLKFYASYDNLHHSRNIVLYGAQSASWKNLQHTTSSWRGITGIGRLFGRTEGEGQAAPWCVGSSLIPHGGKYEQRFMDITRWNNILAKQWSRWMNTFQWHRILGYCMWNPLDGPNCMFKRQKKSTYQLVQEIYPSTVIKWSDDWADFVPNCIRERIMNRIKGLGFWGDVLNS